MILGRPGRRIEEQEKRRVGGERGEGEVEKRWR